ncbi:coenzyme Q-binding protein COQ10 homolog B, mitochondrial [Rhopalosiphum maidis]|uniref:coenzyme Q-binding protein COQ10 homolog B, mitochondrial n=1 Tax=Rhopalosiphum maidis TaxID=43146 RepID=UPI000EFF5A04|nr:coenzyme Q-binding protein COQ10 homolog B, mitochondrial [Rhopalosiphum maidis]
MSRATFMNLRRLTNTNASSKNREWKFISLMNGKDIFYSTSCLTKIAITPKYLYGIQIRHFINVFNTGINNGKKYKEKQLIGYSPEQMFDVIQDTENYKHFLPFCRQSTVKVKGKDHAKTYLEIGFPPIIESYVSHITFQRPHMIKAECRDGKLFKYLLTQWNCDPGLKDNPNTCVITFFVSYEFKSQLHSALANMFFNELVKQMEHAFFVEAGRRYGKPCIKAQKL